METISLTAVDQNKQTALSAVEALSKHDVDAVFKNCAFDFLDYGAGSSKPEPLESGIQFFSAFIKAFPDYNVSNLRCVADEEWAMVWGNCSGTWMNEFMKQKPNGKAFKFGDVDIFRFNSDGRIKEHYNIVDLNGILKEVGVQM